MTAKLGKTKLAYKNNLELLKPFPFLWVDDFNMVIHQMAVPGLHFTWVGFTSEITKVTLSCPSHFIVDPGSFCDAFINIVVIPLECVPGGRLTNGVYVFGSGGCLLLPPGFTYVGNIEGVKVKFLRVPESLWGGGSHRACSLSIGWGRGRSTS